MSLAAEQEITPAERRRRKVRSAILDAAEKVFAEEGEAGLSIRRLAEEIDYSPAAIYRYFESKEELVDELKEAFFERILILIDESRRSDQPFAIRARTCVSAYIRAALEKPHHYAAAFSGIAQGGAPLQLAELCCAEPFPDEPAPHETGSNKARAFDFLVEMISTGQDGGHLRRDLDPAHAAFCTWAACHGMAMIIIHTQALPPPGPGPAQAGLDAIIDGHADIFVRGLETHPASARLPDSGASAGSPHGPSSHVPPQDPADHD